MLTECMPPNYKMLTLFKYTCTLTMTDNILEQKRSLSKFKNTGTMQSISNHDEIKLIIIDNKIFKKSLNTVKLNNTFLNSPWSKFKNHKGDYKIFHT